MYVASVWNIRSWITGSISSSMSASPDHTLRFPPQSVASISTSIVAGQPISEWTTTVPETVTCLSLSCVTAIVLPFSDPLTTDGVTITLPASRQQLSLTTA